MKRYVDFRTEAGDTIRVETNEPETREMVQGEPAPISPVRAPETFEDTFAKGVQPIAAAVARGVLDLRQPPTEVSVTFGLTLGAGTLIVGPTVEGSIEVTLTWRP